METKNLKSKLKSKPQPNKLNLGCGQRIMKGYVNLDFLKLDGVDVVHNLEKFPWPFKDNTFDEVYTSHVLEHLSDLVKVMTELRRICKNHAKIRIIVPHFSCGNAYRDPTHKHNGFSLFTFVYFTDKSFYQLPQFKIIKRKPNFIGQEFASSFFIKSINNIFNSIVNLNQKIYERFFCWIFPVYEIYIELEVIK